MGHQAIRSRNAFDIKDGKKPSIEFVLIVMRVHLFPYRTQKLSSCTPTILGGRLPGKIGNANTKPRLKSRGFFLPASVHRTLATGRTILGLPGKTCNANTKSQEKSWLFFTPGTCPRHVPDGVTILGLPRKVGNANTKPRLKSRGFFAYFKEGVVLTTHD